MECNALQTLSDALEARGGKDLITTLSVRVKWGAQELQGLGNIRGFMHKFPAVFRMEGNRVFLILYGDSSSRKTLGKQDDDLPSFDTQSDCSGMQPSTSPFQERNIDTAVSSPACRRGTNRIVSMVPTAKVQPTQRPSQRPLPSLDEDELGAHGIELPSPGSAAHRLSKKRRLDTSDDEHQECSLAVDAWQMIRPTRRPSQNIRPTKTPVKIGMPPVEYLQGTGNVFEHKSDSDTVSLLNPAMADSDPVKDEAFVVQEFETLIESKGPIVYISTLCGNFMGRNGCSVTSIISHRPLELFKRHSEIFLPVGEGNVTLQKYRHLPEVQKLLGKTPSKTRRVSEADIESQMPVPDVITEQHVVEEFRRLILSDRAETVYISSLCGRFLQRFKVPVASILDCKPAEFLRRYPDMFVMAGGGHVGLREVLGPDAVSIPAQPQKGPKKEVFRPSMFSSLQ